MADKPVKPPVTIALLRHGGSHLIRPLVKKMARRPIVEPGNHGFAPDHIDGPVIVFLRDPRNRTVSALRWAMNKSDMSSGAPDDELAALIRSPVYMRDMLAWAKRWCSWPGALMVRYETFANESRGIAEIDRIAGFLDLSDIDASSLYAWIWRTSRTVQSVPSDYREWFRHVATKAWADTGGAELVRTMGYE